MDKTLPTDLLGKIFTYLPISEAARFERLNSLCGAVIRRNRIYYDRPDIHVDVTSKQDGLYFNIQRGKKKQYVAKQNPKNCLKEIKQIHVSNEGLARSDRKFPKIETTARKIKTILGFQVSNPLTIKFVIRDIRWNINTIYSKWGYKTDYGGGIPFLQMRIDSICTNTDWAKIFIRTLLREKCKVDLLTISIPYSLMPLNIIKNNKLIQATITMGHYRVVNKLCIQSYDIRNFDYILPLIREFLDVTVVCRLTPEHALNLVGSLKRIWYSKETNNITGSKSVLLRCSMAKYAIRFPLSDLEALSSEKPRFQVNVEENGTGEYYAYYDRMDQILPDDVLGQIFTYLPISNAARFERLSKKCASAIHENRHHFGRPNINVKVTLGMAGVAFEVFEDSKPSCMDSKYKGQRVSRTFVREKDIFELEYNVIGSAFHWMKNAIGFKEGPPLRSVIRKINKNVKTIYEKWGPRQKIVPRITSLRIVTKSPCPGLSETVATAFAQENTLFDCIYIEFRTYAKCMPIELYNRSLIRNAADMGKCGISSRLYMDAFCLNIFANYIIFGYFDYFEEVTIKCLVKYNELLATLRALKDEREEVRSKPWNVVLHCYVAKYPTQLSFTYLEEESIDDIFVIKVHKTGESRDYEFFTLKLVSSGGPGLIPCL